MAILASSLLARELQARVQAEHISRAEALVHGTAKTLEDYRERVAYLRALRDFAGWITEVTGQIEGTSEKG